MEGAGWRVTEVSFTSQPTTSSKVESVIGLEGTVL